MALADFDLERLDLDMASVDKNRRWQAAIALGEFCEDAPQVIWPLVLKWGSSSEADTRTAIATCVLEHILEHHFAEFFPLVCDVIDKGDRAFCDTFSQCWQFGQAQAPENASLFTRLQAKAWQLASGYEPPPSPTR